ncbi:hypothetical protein [Flavobacterium geliluteum]|uniref:Uncharacterized protein n=1 Tax=Flavobacterium geliluteum TaxID=2816120 RepID=A0A940X8W0_9FLAO|nr:hypothetical protein [Flavobacterium geliluteum]MBP4138406.1 hypothetical protein [Flavobacterium geliluteum]
MILKVKKSPLFGRLVLYIITFLSVFLPLSGFILNILDGDGFKFLNIVFLLVFGLISFFMLRISLWNTYGKEIIILSENKLTYIADYKWFKDKIKEFNFEKIHFTLNKVGYEEEKKAVLIINFENGAVLETVTKIDSKDLNNLLLNLNQNIANTF